jgi:hypothetical protein
MTYKTSLAVLLLVLAAGAVLAQPMSGTYTIKPDGTGDFLSPYLASQALSSRTTGGNVTFIIYPGTYSDGYLYLYSCNQSRPQDTITFKPAPGAKPVIVSTTSYAVYGYYTNNVKLLDLELRCSSSYGLYMGGYCDNWKVENCIVRAVSYGVYMSSGCDYDTIIGCDIRVTSSYGMYLYNSSYAYGLVIANNMITGWTSYGIYGYYGYYWKILYNTVIGTGSYAMMSYYQYGDTLKNNIFQGASYAMYRYYGDAYPAYSNYNCFWLTYGGSSSDLVIYSSTYGGQTVAQWNTSTGRDGNSLQANPLTGGVINPHLKTGSPCINAGNPWSGITKDIDGDTRSTSTPCIGADEYTSVGSAMSGTYYIKPNTAAGDTYPTFNKATGDLAVRGQAGNVTFVVFAGTYAENLELTGLQNGPYWVNYIARTSGSPPRPDEVTMAAGSSYGVTLRGNKRIRFRNINVSGFTSYGFYLYPITSVAPYITPDTLVIDGCNITGANGIYLYAYYGGSDDTIMNCFIRAASSYGIYKYGSSSYPNYRNFIANNIITGWTTYGIYHYYGYYNKIVYNTIIGTGSYALYQYYQYNDTLKNNILQATTYAMYKMYGSSVPDYCNYNCFWLNGGSSLSTVIYSSYGAQTLVNWRTSSGRDGNSIQADPLTGAPINPHLKTGSPCINAGNPWPGITTDIDGDTRSTSTPCIGADEYTSVGSAMSGVYTIKQAGGGDYRSFLEALGDLALRGFGGNVQFDVYTGQYSGVPGGSAAFNFEGIGNGANRLIIRGYPGEAVTLLCQGFSYGIRLYNNQRIRLANMTATGASSYGVYATSASTVTNTTDSCCLDGMTINAPSPVMWYYGDYDTLANCFLNASSSYGIYWYGYSVSPYSQGNVMYNNMVRGWLSYGLYNNYQNGLQLYYNSFQGPGSYAHYCYYNYNLTMRNNIFMAASYAMYYYYGDVFPTSSNYNVFRLNGGSSYVIYHYNYGSLDLTGWRTNSQKDTNSLDSDPLFVSATDLHLQSSSPCINAGQAVTGIAADIDGDSRTSGTPDIGADEFYIDIAASEILAPASMVPVGATFQPSARFRSVAGPRATFYAKMVITRGAAPAYTDSVQVSVNPGDSVVATFANWTPTIVASNYRATCYHLIAGDAVPTNDTVVKQFAVGNVDAGVVSILIPPDQAPLGGTIYPRVVVRNYGDFEASCDVMVTINDPTDGDLNSGATPTDEAAPKPLKKVGLDATVYDTTETVIIAVGAQETLTFTKSWTPAVMGNHTAACRVGLLYDTDPTNDYLAKPFTVERIDFGATQVVAPSGNVTQNTAVAPSVKLKNFGSASAACAARIIIVSGSTTVYDQTESGIVIGSGAEVTRVFATPWNATQLGPFTVTAYTAHEFDTDPTNDSSFGSGAVVPGGGGSGVWTCVSQMPSGIKPVGDGGWLAYADGPQRLFAARGNKQPDFFAYDIAGINWESKAGIPDGTEAKKPGKGAVGTPYPSVDGFIYALKGNNTLGFYRYDIGQDSWKQLSDIPQGTGKKVKGGSDLVYHNGKVYCLKGITNEFLAYDVASDSWKPLSPVPAPNTKFDKGSWLCLDEAAGKIYCHQAKYHAYYAYDIAGGTWGAALKGMPTINSLGKKKKSKDGGSGTFRNDAIFAFKGGNTQEFWKYAIVGDSWSQLDDVPLIGLSGAKKKVKGGGDLVALNPQPNPVIYGMKGNKSNDLWTYEYFGAVAQTPLAERSGVMAVNTDNRRVSLAISPNPLATGFATVSYSLPQPAAATVRVYDATGRAVMVRSLADGRSGQVGLDLRSLSAGVYLVKLSTESLTATHKLVVER